MEHLKTKQCDSDPYQPKIWCDDIVELEDILETYEDSDIITTTEFFEEFEGIEERFQTRFGGIMDNRKGSAACQGSLKVTHMTSKF